MNKETKQLILEAVKAGVCIGGNRKGKTLKGIPKTVKAALLPPPGSATTMANTPSAMPA